MTGRTYYVPINGAVSMSELKIDGDMVQMPEMNEEYKCCIISDGNIHVSKDGRVYSLGVSVKIGEEEISRETLLRIFSEFTIIG